MMRRSRTPKNYDGTELTAKHLADLLPGLLQKLEKRTQERPDLILAYWKELIGAKFAPMTEAQGFREGVLTVKVKNSTLYSLLVQHEKARLLKSLREKFPSVSIHNIVFRLG